MFNLNPEFLNFFFFGPWTLCLAPIPYYPVDLVPPELILEFCLEARCGGSCL
jgi:hypothetical protein